ncbi:MAG: response regulator [Aureliella sp.]
MESHSTTATVHILLVEDDSIDAESVKRAFRSRKIANPMTIVEDGIAALERLRGEDGSAPLTRPFLILLDLNMPRMNGIEFLENLRADPNLHDSIVFVLTTSDADRDKVSAYEQHIAGYLVKSRVGEEFEELVNMLDNYWRYVEFPPKR